MKELVKISDIKGLILELRGQKVMLDRDLANLYQVSTKRLNQAVKRNKDRFPQDFVFQLNDYEVNFLVSQNVTPHKKYFGGHNPYAFTRNGANMLSAILRSQIAVKRSIQIMRAFSVLEEMYSRKRKILPQSPEIIKQLSTHSKAIMYLFQDNRFKGKQINKVREIQKKMLILLQQMILASLKE